MSGALGQPPAGGDRDQPRLVVAGDARQIAYQRGSYSTTDHGQLSASHRVTTS
jgi:hypothetical protein